MTDFSLFICLIISYILSCNIIVLGKYKTIIGSVLAGIIVTFFYFTPSISRYLYEIPIKYYLISIALGMFVFSSMMINKNKAIERIGYIGFMTFFGSISIGFIFLKVIMVLEIFASEYWFLFFGHPKNYKFDFVERLMILAPFIIVAYFIYVFINKLIQIIRIKLIRKK